MQLRLVSDFGDYYDHWFDREGESFCRLSTSGMGRIEMLDYLTERGIPTPRHGRVEEVAGRILAGIDCPLSLRPVFAATSKLVVFTDEHAHYGEGKELLSLNDALEKYPDASCVEYLPFVVGQSLRFLRAGTRCYWLRYQSLDDWRSNCGAWTVSVVGATNDEYREIVAPLLALDFVFTPDGLRAVDLNVAPKLRGTGVSLVLSGRKIVEGIKEYVAAHSLVGVGV